MANKHKNRAFSTNILIFTFILADVPCVYIRRCIYNENKELNIEKEYGKPTQKLDRSPEL